MENSRSSVPWNSLSVAFKVLCKCTSNSFSFVWLFSSNNFIVSANFSCSSSRHVVTVSFDNEL